MTYRIAALTCYSSIVGMEPIRMGGQEEQQMKPNQFTELLNSIREGGAILRNEIPASRRTTIAANPNRVRLIRERTKLSQADFARFIGISIKTLQNWEQDRRKPSGPAETLLRIIANQPKLAINALHQR
jgi:putative transcriptional regulator